ncbi:MAG: single-stranded-DNA-specific exonuclease RecJ [Syntrophobacterales bacterium]|nr:MAG: single-stranded-DNA-specific exonuclease RecJ [Syntrophobacterales bacterium]
MKRRWEIYPPNPTLQETFSRELEISPITAQVLANRGINQIDQANQFLRPSLSHLHSPFLMKDMDKAVDRIIQALLRREQVLIHGDYDVDGITSTAILILFFQALQFPCRYYIPHRVKEGYGLHRDTIVKFAQQGINLIITADCGISDMDEVKKAQEMGVDVIITDHHEIPDEIPPAYAVLNPKQGDCSFPFKSLAGVGVVFNLIIALRTKLREREQWNDGEIPNLRRYLDLVAMGTVADLVPLQDENRIFVRFGLEELTQGSRLSIRILKEVCGVKDGIITTGNIGFQLAPRINAAGRLGEAQKAIELLVTPELKRAEGIARELNQENSRRQRLEEDIFMEIMDWIKGDDRLLQGSSLVFSSQSWHPGLIGIVASRLVEHYYRPTILISLDGDRGKGSGRSIEGFDLYEGIKRCSPMLLSFGGHRFAIGLTIEREKIEAFKSRFEELVSQCCKPSDFIPRIRIDSEVALSTIERELIEELSLLAPFGPSNPKPIFCSRELGVMDSKIVGENNLKLKVEEDVIYDAIGFRMGHLHSLESKRIRIAFVPQINEWRGVKSIQLELRDILIC